MEDHGHGASRRAAHPVSAQALKDVGEPFDVELVAKSDDADVAILKCGLLTRQVRPLPLAETPPQPGDEVIVLGYPSGIRALLARTDVSFVNQLMSADWRGLSDVFDDIGEQADRRHDSYNVFGARATWISEDEDWSVAVWGRNLGDEAYTINVGPPQPNVNQLNFMYGQPRSYGVALTHNF